MSPELLDVAAKNEEQRMNPAKDLHWRVSFLDEPVGGPAPDGGMG
jgi:hypothetical protein